MISRYAFHVLASLFVPAAVAAHYVGVTEILGSGSRLGQATDSAGLRGYR